MRRREEILQHIALLNNVIQKYAWGSKTAIPELLGKVPNGEPQAELWMGAHPKAPSSANVDGRWVPLTELIEHNSKAVLGKHAVDKYGDKLSFLFKVLAAAEPLSIQAHPNLAQAREGFSRENEAGIPLNAPNRNYKDRNHKPECICALTAFWAMNGFRTIREMLSYLDHLCPDTLGDALSSLSENQSPQGLKRFFRDLMTKPKNEIPPIVNEAVCRAETAATLDPVFSWILRLHDAYPQDIGVLSPAMLNLVCLNPGEAMYLSAGRMHAYLEGTGMELMANSDNVLRGGLTPKHIDVFELLNVLQFTETTPEILKPVQEISGIRRYITPAEEFVLSEITVDGSMRFENRIDVGVEILFCLQGKVKAFDGSAVGGLTLAKGMSMIVPASVKEYTLEGNAIFYRASMGEI